MNLCTLFWENCLKELYLRAVFTSKSIIYPSLVGRRRRVDLTGTWVDTGCPGASAAWAAPALVGQHLDAGGVPLEGHVRVVGGLHQDSVLKETVDYSVEKGEKKLKNQSYRVFHQLVDLCWVHFDLGTSTVCPILQMRLGQIQLSNQARWWNISNLSKPNPSPQADGTPCTVVSKKNQTKCCAKSTCYSLCSIYN